MASTELVPVAAGRVPAVRRRRAEADVHAAGGARISASAARKLRDAVPRNSRDARATRWRSFSQWCADEEWAVDEPNALVSYLSELGDRGHPAKTLEAHFSTIRAMRAIKNSPLSKAEIKACQLIIRHRAGEEADDPTLEPGPLQADGVDPDELRHMVRTLDRTTARGKRDAAVLLIDWWMAAPRLRTGPAQPARRCDHRGEDRGRDRQEDPAPSTDHQGPPVQGGPEGARAGGPHPRPRRPGAVSHPRPARMA